MTQRYTVWYAKNPTFRSNPRLTKENLRDSHVPVRNLDGENLEDVYSQSQGEVWSPNGEARSLIQSLGLMHTSMSVGDVIQQGDDYWEVVPMSFRDIF